jgi:hypothetical protein
MDAGMWHFAAAWFVFVSRSSFKTKSIRSKAQQTKFRMCFRRVPDGFELRFKGLLPAIEEIPTMGHGDV